ncbi:hypothetical protein ABZT47_07095 [Sphaerisporangium sp. NPDC005289]|uniref:hypothetical protein n=1 Tax=Sphaerisporangium sp. NPDC005289 TaxID=3155247 RepID=UPI0033B5E7D6
MRAAPATWASRACGSRKGPYDAAFDRSPQDSRLDALAARARRWLAARRGGLEAEQRPVQAEELLRLVQTSAGTSSPAWDRFAEIAARLDTGS